MYTYVLICVHMANTKKENTVERATITLHTSPAVKNRLDKLSKITDRSRSYLAAEAIERYLAEEEEFIAAVHEGLADADAGRVMTSAQVRASLAKRFRS